MKKEAKKIIEKNNQERQEKKNSLKEHKEIEDVFRAQQTPENAFKPEENSEPKEDIKEKQNIQVKWAVVLMLALIFIIVAIPFIIREVNKFDYIGLEFQKTQLGELIFYSTRFPVVGVQGQVIGNYAINFRSDPRKLEYIPVNIPNSTITFAKNNKGQYNEVFISLNPEMKTCVDNGIALANLAGFLQDSGLDTKSAVTDENYAKDNSLRYATCKSRSADTVITIESGNETKILKSGESCYKIVYKDCEIIPVTEKFTLTILKEYMSHFENL